MKTKLFLAFSFTVFSGTVMNAQVGIGTTTPASSVEIVATNPTGASTNVDGLLVPRVDRQRAQSMTAIPMSTLIYVNSIATGTATGIASNINNVGFYYFDTTLLPAPGKWVGLTGGGSNDWSITGNSGTSVTTNFAGTTDVNDFAFRTNNIERARILSGGHFLVNTTTNDVTSGADNVFEVLATTVGDDAINGYANGAGGTGVSGFSTLTGVGARGENTGTGIGLVGTNSNTTNTQGAGVLANLSSTTTAAATGTFAALQAQTQSRISSAANALNFAGGTGLYGQVNTGTVNPAGTAAVYGSLDQTAAGAGQDVAGVIGVQNNIRQGTGGYAGPLAAATNSALSGVSGTFASKVTTTADAYFFGVIGEVLRDSGVGGSTIPNRTGGVLGYNGSNAWGVLGYRSSAGTGVSVYGGLLAGNIAGGAGKSSDIDVNNNIGLGINGGFMGGYVKGSQYGLLSSGKEFGLYVEGNTLTNKPIIQFNDKRNLTYATVSTSVDITSRGKAKLNNGEAYIRYDEVFANSANLSDEFISINITPMGATNGVYVSKTDKSGFYVKENNGGTSNASFSWMAISIQKGFENGVVISEEILDKNFENNINNATLNDGDTSKTALPIYFDGQKVRFEPMPSSFDKQKSTITLPKKEMINLEEDKNSPK